MRQPVLLVHIVRRCILAMLFLLICVAWKSADAQQFPTAARFCTGGQGSSVDVGDLDKDGDLDIVFGMGRHWPEANLIYLNRGRGVFFGGRSWTVGPESADKTKVVKLGDMDGDGDLDLVVGNEAADPGRVYINDGRANFIPGGQFTMRFTYGIEDTRALALADMDRDGDLDIVAGNWGTQDFVYLNSGKAEFTEKRAFGPQAGYTIALAVGDVDGDRDLDIVTGSLITYLNDGKAIFTAGQSFKPGRDLTTSLVLADIDGDRDLDLIVGHFAAQSLVYLNDGWGTFAAGPTFGTVTDMTRSITVGDMDGDADPDIVVGTEVSVISVDTDGNGKGDAQRTEMRASPNRVHYNDGRGNFSRSETFGTGMDWTRAVALGDMDGDGDLDIAVANACEQNAVFFNALRTP